MTEPAAGTPSTPPARVLVIDDEPQIRKFLDISLRAQGYAVELADDRRARAWTRWRTHGADLVILDLGLPDRDGHDVLRELRQWSQVPVILLTVRAGEAREGRRARCRRQRLRHQALRRAGTDGARARPAARSHAAPAEALPVFDDGRLHVDLARREVRLRRRSRWH